MAGITNQSRNFTSSTTVVEDLCAHLAPAALKGAVGILMCDSQLNGEAIIQALDARLGIPLVGGTTALLPLQESPGEISATLTILQKEGLQVAVAVSPPLQQQAAAAQVEEVYTHCLARLGGPARLLVPLLPLAPGFSADAFVQQLFRLAGDVPVFGGVTTDDLETTSAAVFAEGHAYADRMVLLALGGDICPVFAMGAQVSEMADYAPAVSETDGNLVLRVDDMSFCDYMRSLGIAPEDRINGVDALVQYGPLPVQLRRAAQTEDGVPEIRCISYTDVQQGSAAFSSPLPVGTRISMGLIQKSDVVESAERCLAILMDAMRKKQAEGYEFSLLMSLPCIARYYAMTGAENLEDKLLRAQLPAGLALCSGYVFYEIAPTLGPAGRVQNRTNNASLIMCAL